MEVTGIGLAEVELIVRAVSATRYGHNIEIRTRADIGPRRCRFTLGVRDTGGPGSRGTAELSSSGTGPNGLRRVAAACWHAHYDVLDVLFERAPQARVRTNLASYTVDTFHERAMATANLNNGSPLQPRSPLEGCGCDLDEFAQPAELAAESLVEVVTVIYSPCKERDPLAGSYRILADAFTEPGARTYQAHDGTAWRAGDPVYVPEEVPLWTPAGR